MNGIILLTGFQTRIVCIFWVMLVRLLKLQIVLIFQHSYCSSIDIELRKVTADVMQVEIVVFRYFFFPNLATGCCLKPSRNAFTAD